MHISRFEPGKNDTPEDCIEEVEIREDVENLSVEDFIDAVANTIDKDTTVDMILQNLEQAYNTIQQFKRERICKILFMKNSFEFPKEKEQKTKPVEVKT